MLASFSVVLSRKLYPALVITPFWPEEEVLPSTPVYVTSLSVMLANKGGVLWENWPGELAAQAHRALLHGSRHT